MSILPSQPAGPVWISTTEQSPWQRRTGLVAEHPSGAPQIILSNQRGQRVEGFGAAFSELGWQALESLSESDRSDVLEEVFGEHGLNLSMGRLPIGANDIAKDWYSYDEVEGDFQLRHFTVERDQNSLIPYVRAAQQARSNLMLWASPWSPPTWMKRNRHYACATPMVFSGTPNGLRPEDVILEGEDGFILDEKHLEAYARYFGRYIDAYREVGVNIDMVMPQNEFNSSQPFPSCTWTTAGLAAFIKWLAPEMRERGVEVFLGTLERADDRLVHQLLSDASVADSISGVGVQWAGKGAVAFLHHDLPTLRLYQTEQECGDGSNDWRHARHAWDLLRTYFDSGVNAYFYWNIALEANGLSTWGWRQNSLVVIDPIERLYHFTHEFYLLKHVSAYVQTGARVVPTVSYTGHTEQLVFENPDRSLVIVLTNTLSTPLTVTVDLGGAILRPTLFADSFNTIVLSEPEREAALIGHPQELHADLKGFR